MPRFWSSWYFVICAEERPQNASTATAHAIDLSCCVRIVSSLKVEVEAEHQTIVGQVRSIGRKFASTDPRVLVVPSKTCPAVHEWVIAIAEHVIVDVPQVRWHGSRIRLLRHPHQF